MALKGTTKKEQARVSEDESTRFSAAEDLIISRALQYPYERPAQSYLYQNGRSHALPATLPDKLHFVLAIGSNASAQQLRRKYGDATIPVVSARVHGLDVVYAAVLSGYGSIPATVVRGAGACDVHATLLTGPQVRRMHETEGGYDFCRVVGGRGVRVVAQGREVADVLVYVARAGAFTSGGEVFGLEEIGGVGRAGRRVRQREMQRVVSEACGGGLAVEEFVLGNVRDAERRRAVVRRMQGTGAMDDCFEVIENLSRFKTSID